MAPATPFCFWTTQKHLTVKKDNGFNGVGNYSEWPKVAGAVIQAQGRFQKKRFLLSYASSHVLKGSGMAARGLVSLARDTDQNHEPATKAAASLRQASRPISALKVQRRSYSSDKLLLTYVQGV